MVGRKYVECVSTGMHVLEYLFKTLLYSLISPVALFIFKILLLPFWNFRGAYSLSPQVLEGRRRGTPRSGFSPPPLIASPINLSPPALPGQPNLRNLDFLPFPESDHI